MNELTVLLEECFNKNFIQLIASSPKNFEKAEKIKVRPVLIRDSLLFQSALFKNNQVYHENLTKEELMMQVLGWIKEDFKQIEIDTSSFHAVVLISKKGKITIKKKRTVKKMPVYPLEHNRIKRYLLEEGKPVEFLIDLGVMTKEGRIVQSKYDKFRQINRFLEFIRDVLPKLQKDRELTIIDFGCGKSYLTFAMYYYLSVLENLDIRVIGLDLKEDVIRSCGELAKRYGFQKLDFFVGDIASYEGVERVDMVVTLHACDTATDYALAKAVKWGAEVILSVPCCQHELNRQIHNAVLKPVLQYGIIKERICALVTDAFRAGLLEEQGYQVQILEFIDMEHTPKNILIRAVKGNGKKKANEDLSECMKFLCAAPTLKQLLKETEGGAEG